MKKVLFALAIVIGLATLVVLLLTRRHTPEVYRHPLLALNDWNGRLPLYDELDDPRGRRYVIGEGASRDEENGSERRHSGVFFAERRSMTREEVDKTDPPLTLSPLPPITQALAEVLAAAPAGGRLQVMASVKNNLPSLQVELERAIAKGQIHSDYEEGLVRDQLLGQRQRQIAVLMRPIQDAMLALNARVDYVCQNAPCLVATIPANTATSLASRPDIVQLDIVSAALPNDQEPVFEAPTTIITGVTVRHGLQIQQFIENSYDGNGLSDQSEADNIVVAVVESGTGFDDDHAGFRDGGPTSSFRYATGGGSTGKWECTGNGCFSVLSFATPKSHATGAAGIVLGDLEQGQIPSVPVAVRPTVSGYAREAVAHLYAFSGGSVTTLDHIGGLTSSQKVPDIVSNSWGVWDSPRCAGTSAVAQAANQLYEDGIAVIAAAHNFGGAVNDCNVTAPGSAIGAFTVGAHHFGYEGNPNTVRTAPIYDIGTSNPSSWGGNPTEGQNRSIIDITAPGTRRNKFNTSGSFSPTGVICCTSLATPHIAAAAANFMDFYHHEYGNYIDNPGSLYANLLLMGDRQGINGKGLSSPDHRWGTGRLRMRMFNSAGLDGPYYYFNGTTCISDGEVYDFNINEGNPVSADADVVKAAAFWFDTRHDGSSGGVAGSVADVDLYIMNKENNTQLILPDTDSFDNKARVFHEDVGGLRMAIRLVGYDVNGHDDPTCGQDAIRVYFAFFVEDSDRESPTYNPTTGLGIFPEEL